MRINLCGFKDYVRYSKICTITQENYIVDIAIRKYKKWVEGKELRILCPELTHEEREFIKTSLTPQEQKKIFN